MKGVITIKKKKKIIKEGVLLFYLLIYKCILELIYIFQISPVYSYLGLAKDLNFSNFIISNLILLIISLCSPKNKKYPSSYLYLIIEVLILVPTLSYYWLNNQGTNFIFWEMISLLLISFILKFKRKKITGKLKLKNIILIIIFWMYIAISLYIIHKRGGLNFKSLSFKTVYEVRETNNINGFLLYILNWSCKAFMPFYFGYFVYKKNKIYVILSLLISILYYLSFGNKAFLFSVIFIVYIYLIIESRNTAKKFLLTFLGLNLTSYILTLLNITNALRDIITVRLLYIPSMIQFNYYKFFLEFPKLKFSEGVIGKFLSISYNYNESIGKIINNFFIKSLESNANTGVFAYAYADFGSLGMIGVGICLGLIFWIIDSISFKLPLYIPVCSISYICFGFNDVNLLINIWTGGLFLVMILIFIFNSNIKMKAGYKNYKTSNLALKKIN